VLGRPVISVAENVARLKTTIENRLVGVMERFWKSSMIYIVAWLGFKE
jgi:hypothetical protein